MMAFAGPGSAWLCGPPCGSHSLTPRPPELSLPRSRTAALSHTTIQPEGGDFKNPRKYAPSERSVVLGVEGAAVCPLPLSPALSPLPSSRVGGKSQGSTTFQTALLEASELMFTGVCGPPGPRPSSSRLGWAEPGELPGSFLCPQGRRDSTCSTVAGGRSLLTSCVIGQGLSALAVVRSPAEL